MKYNFVDKAKDLTPEDIKAQMNFDNVVKGASIWAGFKLGSVLLKLGSKVTTSIVAGTSTVVVTTAVVVGTTTDVFKTKSSEVTAQPIPIEIEYQQEDDMVPPMDEEVAEDTSATTSKPKQAPVKKTILKPLKTAVKPLPQSKVVPHTIVPNNVTTDAMPLPDLLTFEKFIDKELVYPVSLKNGKRVLVEGYVDVLWTVNRKGEAINFKIRKSLGEAFDNEAIRVLKKYPNWEPARFNDNAVESNLTFKVYFKVK